jgi:hypothetical protein
MKGSPRSLVLSWANAVAGFWSGLAANAMRRQGKAAMTAMTKPPGKQPTRRTRSRTRKRK